jgi:hypothetical protein
MALPQPLDSFPYALAFVGRQLYAGLGDGRIYASQDAGEHWEPLRLRSEALERVIDSEKPDQAIVFVRTKIRCDQLYRKLREQAVRRYLPMIGVIVMGVAVIFTLSRGGLIGLVVGLLALIGLLSASGRARRSLVVTAALLITVVAYGGWIGFGPWVARLAQTPAGSLDRLTQYIASLPLLREFPILGVGLGASGIGWALMELACNGRVVTLSELDRGRPRERSRRTRALSRPTVVRIVRRSSTSEPASSARWR